MQDFLDATFPKCCFHLPGQLYRGCVCIFSSTAPLAAPCQAPAHIVRLWPILWHWNRCPSSEGYAFWGRAPHPCPIRVQMTFNILKRRNSPGCILLQPLHTLSLSARGWSLASSHCVVSDTLRLGSSWMLLLFRCAPRTGVCSQGRELCP